MLRIVDDACCRKDGKLCIVIEGANPEEVISSAAKQLATEKAAACGYVHTGYNSHSGAYPLDGNGAACDTDEKLAELTERLRKGETSIAAYRNDIFLIPRL